MTILITRPHEQGRKLCSLLEQHGHNVIYQPLIEIVGLDHDNYWLYQLERYHIIIAVSQHAIEHAAKKISQAKMRWPINCNYFAIGNTSAISLQNVTKQNVQRPNISDSEHLLKLILPIDMTGCNILILRGTSGRELIKNTLEKRGANVDYAQVYTRKFLPFDPNTSIINWQNAKVDKVLVTSFEQLEFLCLNIQDNLQWINTLTLYVPSLRIAQAAQQVFGFKKVIVTYSAANQNLLTIFNST